MKEFDQDLAVEEDRVDTINHLADKLIQQGHAGSALIYHRQQALNERWNRLQDKASERRQRLAEACEIHAFDRSCVDVANMINEKVFTANQHWNVLLQTFHLIAYFL
jgi:spectrin beta